MKKIKRNPKKIVTNCDKLKGLLVEKKKNYKKCAAALGISEYQFRMKINGKTDFWVSEIIILSNFLGLTDAECIAVFLPHMIKIT